MNETLYFPVLINERFLQFWDSEHGMINCITRWVTSHNFQIKLYVLLYKDCIVSWQIVYIHVRLKGCILQHFIWVFTVWNFAYTCIQKDWLIFIPYLSHFRIFPRYYKRTLRKYLYSNEFIKYYNLPQYLPEK